MSDSGIEGGPEIQKWTAPEVRNVGTITATRAAVAAD